MLRSVPCCGYYEFRGAGIVVQQSNKRKSTTDKNWFLKKPINVIQKDCRASLTIFHLLLFGVTTTIIIKVGKVVASSVSLVSAVRAKLDSCYLQRQVSISEIIQTNNNQSRDIFDRWMRLAPVPVSKHKIFKRNGTYYRRR